MRRTMCMHNIIYAHIEVPWRKAETRVVSAGYNCGLYSHGLYSHGLYSCAGEETRIDELLAAICPCRWAVRPLADYVWTHVYL